MLFFESFVYLLQVFSQNLVTFKHTYITFFVYINRWKLFFEKQTLLDEEQYKVYNYCTNNGNIKTEFRTTLIHGPKLRTTMHVLSIMLKWPKFWTLASGHCIGACHHTSDGQEHKLLGTILHSHDTTCSE